MVNTPGKWQRLKLWILGRRFPFLSPSLTRWRSETGSPGGESADSGCSGPWCALGDSKRVLCPITCLYSLQTHLPRDRESRTTAGEVRRPGRTHQGPWAITLIAVQYDQADVKMLELDTSIHNLHLETTDANFNRGCPAGPVAGSTLS